MSSYAGFGMAGLLGWVCPVVVGSKNQRGTRRAVRVHNVQAWTWAP